MVESKERFRGLILGTAVGDSVGLPAEGLSRKRNKRFFKGNWKQRFVCGKGMVSDDTEHTIFVALGLLKHSDDPDAFIRRLAWSLRWWIVRLPAGVGLATARAILKLWLGFSAKRSGVYSAGNGAAMRVAPIGAFFSDQPSNVDLYTRCATEITHSDPKAFYGALAIARITAWIVRDNLTERPDANALIGILQSVADDEDWLNVVEQVKSGLQRDLSVAEFAHSLGLGKGVSGYVYHTVPICVFAWYRHFGDFEKALVSVIECGGDADTTGAITGALAGVTVGECGIPKAWVANLAEWPCTTEVMRAVADALADKGVGNDVRSVHWFWPGIMPRNLFFLAIVLLHGLRRLLPPYG